MATTYYTTKNCQQCNREFRATKRGKSTPRFCSLDCVCEYLKQLPKREYVPINTPEERFWAKVDKCGPDECWEWQGRVNEKGYGLFRISGKTIRAHRFSLELHKGKLQTGYFALHTCDNPPCCNPNHLYAGTLLQNIHDKMERGTQIQKLDPDSVRYIRSQRGKQTQVALAAELGVSIPLICRVQSRRIWGHVED